MEMRSMAGKKARPLWIDPRIPSPPRLCQSRTHDDADDARVPHALHSTVCSMTQSSIQGCRPYPAGGTQRENEKVGERVRAGARVEGWPTIFGHTQKGIE